MRYRDGGQDGALALFKFLRFLEEFLFEVMSRRLWRVIRRSLRCGACCRPDGRRLARERFNQNVLKPWYRGKGKCESMILSQEGED